MTAYFTELNGDMMTPRASLGVCFTTDILSVQIVDCYPVCAKFSLLTHSHGKNMMPESESLLKSERFQEHQAAGIIVLLQEKYMNNS